jgi:superfamily II DNA or RNA helicase
LIQLRPYQQELLDGTLLEFSQGLTRVLVVAPCGAGKSYIFARMAQRCRNPVLILVHRRELKRQHEELLAREGIANARVEMIFTEAKRLGRHPAPGLIILDEAHLSRSASWQRVIEYYNTWTVGLTATPIRLDGRSLGDTFQAIVQGVSVRWLVEHKHLAPYEYYAPFEVETDGLRRTGGDFNSVDLAALMSSNAIYSDALKSWLKIAEGEKTICYCVSIHHAAEMAQRFKAAGYSAACISADTPEARRAAVMDDFRAGRVKILCNVGIISEGVSIDDVTCCLLLRPTESHALYWQQAMRCMRYQPGKVAKIIDCAGNYSRNPMPMDDVTWSLDAPSKRKPRLNDAGDFFIRSCPECFMTFETAPICPFCGTVYPLKPREIKAHEEIELRQITEAEAEKMAAEKRRMRQEVGMAHTLPELLEIAKKRGYSPRWAYMMLKARKK